jgi:AcrR family transcriptional regulator
MVNMVPAEKRAYSSTLREEHAAQTRERVLRAASACFTENGYAGTSLAQIAKRAGVSVDTVQATGPKRDILLGAFEVEFAGSETKELLEGDNPFADALAAETPSAMLAALTDATIDTVARIRGLWWAFRGAAAADPAVAQILAELLSRRRRDYLVVVELVESRGLTVADVDAVVDEAQLVVTPETYTHFVDDFGWSEQRYRRWAQERIAAVVLGSTVG